VGVSAWICDFVSDPVVVRPGGQRLLRAWVRADQAGLNIAVHDAVPTWLTDTWPFPRSAALR
jgi:hypothetical protein